MTIQGITESDIANYLANPPGFFERHAELLGTVQLTSPHGLRAEVFCAACGRRRGHSSISPSKTVSAGPVISTLSSSPAYDWVGWTAASKCTPAVATC